MANQLNVELNMRDNGYSNGIKSAQQALSNLAKENGITNASFRNQSKEIKSAQKYFASLSAQYSQLSDEAKQSEFGVAVHQQMQQAEKDLEEMYIEAEKVNRKLKELQDTAKEKVGINVDNKTGAFSWRQMGKDIMGNLGMGSLAEAGGLRAAAGIAGMAAGVGVAVAAYQGLSSAIKNNIETAKEFEKSCSSIQALTGANVQTMNQLKQAAIELGGSTTQSATQVMQAFGMIGSQAPQLLEDANALANVTKYAIMLSEAAGIDLTEAAAGVTGVLNQFGLSAGNAKDVVNMLAAASQKGAGNVGYLNSAITKCGSVAGALGVTTHETISAIEQLAQAGIDASSAGNTLKNIMLKLEASSNTNLKPSVVGLVKALQNLRDMQMSSTQVAKMFGTENVAAALTLTKAADSAEQMAKAIQNTNTAEEQQKINNDNLDGSLKNLESKWEAFNLAINQSNGLLRDCIDATADLVAWFTKLIKETDAATQARIRYNIVASGGKVTDNDKDGVDNQVKEVAEQKTYADKIRKRNEIKDVYQQVIDSYDADIKKVAKQIKQAERALVAGGGAGVGHMLQNLTEESELLAKSRDETIKALAEFNKKSLYAIGKKYDKLVSDNVTSNTDTDNGDDTLAKAKQAYAATLQQIEQKELLMLYNDESAAINEQKALDAKIKAMQTYLDALTKDKSSVDKNRVKINELTSQITAYKTRLAQVTKTAEDYTIIKNANQKYSDAIDQLNKDRQNGWITEDEYNTQYISALQSLIDSYKSVKNVSDELKKSILEAKTKISNIEGLQRQKDLADAYQKFEVSKLLARDKINDVTYNKTPNKLYADERERYYKMLNLGRQFMAEVGVEVDDKSLTKWLEDTKAKFADLGYDISNELNNTETQHYQYWLQNIKQEMLELAVIDMWEHSNKGALALMGLNNYLKAIGETTVADADAADKLINKLQEGRFWAHPDNKVLDWMQNGYNITNSGNKKTQYIGDETNYKINAISHNRLTQLVNVEISPDSITKMQHDLDDLLAKHKAKQEVVLELQDNMQTIKMMDPTFDGNKFLADASKDLLSLEAEVLKIGKKIQGALTFEARINASIDGLSSLQSLTNYTQDLYDFRKRWKAINDDDDADGFAKGLQKTNLIISQLISTMQVYNTVLQLCTSMQTLFAAASTAAAAQDAAATATIVADSMAKTSAESGEAIAGATSSGARLPFPYNIAAIAAGVAAVISAISMISSFANGGVVTGGNFSGDQALVRANRGEMILNNRQQKNLFDVLDGKHGMISGTNQVEFVLRGSELVGLINNYNSKKSRVK